MRRLDGITDMMPSVDMNQGKLQEMVKDKEAWGAAVNGTADLDTTWQLNNTKRIAITIHFKMDMIFKQEARKLSYN